MQDVFVAISNFGFPVVVATYLLLRFENKIEKFGEKITKFSDVIEGKPSEGKVGLIKTMEENNTITKKLVTQISKLSQKIK